MQLLCNAATLVFLNGYEALCKFPCAVVQLLALGDVRNDSDEYRGIADAEFSINLQPSCGVPSLR